jgi:protein involved in polysaccharide export with SLBB domain
MNRIFLALLVLLLAACSSMQPVRVSDLEGVAAPEQIAIGDRVEVTTRDQEKFEFAVREINEAGLGGEFGFIPYANMRKLRVRQPGSDAGDLTWLWAILGVAAAALLISNADSVTVCSPGPCPTPTR